MTVIILFLSENFTLIFGCTVEVKLSSESLFKQIFRRLLHFWFYSWTFFSYTVEAVDERCSVKKVFLEISQNSQENTCARVPFLINLQPEACNFIKKETLAQVFSCEFCEVSKNTFSTEHLWATASL